jgi:hypothetical protein
MAIGRWGEKEKSLVPRQAATSNYSVEQLRSAATHVPNEENT